MEQALVLTILGMGTVLIVLFVINLMIIAMGKLFAERKLPALPEAPPPPALSASPGTQGESDELIAVITAAIAACMGRAASLVVRPFAPSSGAWSAAARSENTQK